ncbi:MAG: hypothetical protein V8T10_10080 [Merdibacter sp.]
MKTLIQRTAALQRRLGTSFDLVYRSIQIQSVQAEMIFLSSLTDARPPCRDHRELCRLGQGRLAGDAVSGRCGTGVG